MIRRVALPLALLLAAAACSAAGANPSLSAVFSAHDWLNAKISQADVRGKVVVLDFYTFGCINCKRTEPNLRALYHDKSRNDLVIISVHSPETAFERDRRNLVASLKEQGIAWPVVVDNDFTVWNSYGIEAWPTQMIFDRRGVLRKTVVGDSQDEIVNQTIDNLIRM